MTLSKRKKNVILIILATIITVVVAFFGWKAYRDSNPQSYIDFKQLIPTKIVNDYTIKKNELVLYAAHPLMWFKPYEITISSSLGNSNYTFIKQSKSEGDGTITTDGFSCSVMGARCFSKITPRGQAYLHTLHHNASDPYAEQPVYDKLSSQTVMFVKDGTSIFVAIDADDTREIITDEAWSTMIDSFEPTTFTDLKVVHRQPGP